VRHPSPGRLACLTLIATAVAFVACVDTAFGPGARSAAGLRVSVTLPAMTPAAWAPDGETLHVVVRRAGRVEPVIDTAMVIAGEASMVLQVPLSQATERFVATAEVKYGASVLFLGFDVVQLDAGLDTALTLVARYVGPGAGAASYTLGARDSSLAPGDTASLMPQVQDSLGQSIPNVPVRYIASRPALISVDTGGLLSGFAAPGDTARVTGYLPMGLSSDLVVTLGSVVVVPPNRTKTWTGGAPGEPMAWSNSGNWSPAGVPEAGDTVVVEATLNDPVLTGSETIAALTIAGGTLTLANGRLLVTGDFGTTGGAGGGNLSMTSMQDTLRVLGSATFAGRAVPGALDNGVLRVGGDFDAPQVDGSHGFSAGTSHRTVLDGAQPQRLWFGGGDAGARFGDLEIANASGSVRIGLEHQIHVAGKLRVTTPVTIDDGSGGNGDVQLEVEDSLVMAAGSRLTVVELTLGGGMAVAGEFVPAPDGAFRVRFNGSGQRIQAGLAYRDVEVNEDALLTGSTTFDGALDMTGALDLAGHALVVTGTLHTHNGDGRLVMRQATDRLEVRGDAVFEGDSLAGDLTDGVLRVAGTFEQLRYSNTRRTFRASGNHRTILDGGGSQAMRFADPASFGHLEIATQGGPIGITADQILVSRTFRISTAVDVVEGGSEPTLEMDVGDSVVLAVDSRLEVESLRVRGALVVGGTLDAGMVEFAGIDQEIPADVAYRNLAVTGAARLAGRTVATQGISLRGPLATLTLNGHTLQGTRLSVGNGFGLPVENTSLVMQHAADSLIITEDASFSSAMAAGSLSAGVLAVSGGFFQSESPLAFRASGTHKTVLAAPPGFAISFEHPGTGAGESSFRHLEVVAQADLFLRTDVVVSGTLSGGGTPATFIRSGTGASLRVGGADVDAMSFDNVRVAVNGALTRFDNVTFLQQGIAATQLEIVHPGAATPFTLTGIRFLVTPTTGAYISATDPDPLDGRPLRIEMAASTPSDGSAHTITAGGAVVDWLGFADGTFSPVGSMDVARFSAAAALLGDGRVLIAGGRPTIAVGSITASANTFSPVLNTFTATGDLRRPRRAFDMVALADGRVLVVGGANTTGTEHFNEIYDPVAATFTLIDSLGHNPGCRGRYTPTSTRLADGRVLIAGGDGVSTPGPMTTCFPLIAELFDPATNTFAATGALPAGRSRHTATLLADGRVLLAAGISVGPSIASAETFDPGTGSFAPTGNMAAARFFHTATRLNDGRVLVVGGENGPSLSSAELYDPATGTFSATGSMSVGRARHLAVLLADGRVLIAGGRATDGSVFASVEIYDPGTGTFSIATPMTSARFWATAVRLADGRVLIAGGTDNGTVGLLSAEVYTP
jgi:hypothetical protein